MQNPCVLGFFFFKVGLERVPVELRNYSTESGISVEQETV